MRVRDCVKVFLTAVCMLSSALASAQVYYYVDPDWSGTANGLAATPWPWLDSSAWNKINSSLASDDVTVYFSAREAADDTNETTTMPLTILRTNTSVHSLTLDGMSQYNTSDSSPSWSSNSGSSRFRIRANYPVSTGSGVKRNYVTVRGFVIVATDGQGLYWWGGDHVIIEHNDISAEASATLGPGLTVEYVRKSGDTEQPCVPDDSHNCGVLDLTIQNNTVHDTFGECIYIGGCDSSSLDCSFYASDYHDRINILNNTVYDCARRGGEGDGIDPHGHIKNMTISGNTVYNTDPAVYSGRDCIISENGGIIEKNLLYNCGRNGITMSEYWNKASGFRNDAILRNNIVVKAGVNSAYSQKYGIYFNHMSTGDSWLGAKIYNNTVYSAGDIGLFIEGGLGFDVRNNIIANSGSTEFYATSGTIEIHNHNNYHDSAGTVWQYGSDRVNYNGSINTYEPYSIVSNPEFNKTDTPFKAVNFMLMSDSKAIRKGAVLDGFSTDYSDNPRHQGAWDMGAFENPIPIPAPKNLMVLTPKP